MMTPSNFYNPYNKDKDNDECPLVETSLTMTQCGISNSCFQNV